MKKRTKRDKYLDMIYVKYGENGDNLYPKPMSDSEFRKIIIDYLWGEKRYIVDPVSQQQANVYIIVDIIKEHKPKEEPKKKVTLELTDEQLDKIKEMLK